MPSRLLPAAFRFALLLLLLAGPAAAHGGTYRGYPTGGAPSHPYGPGIPNPGLPPGATTAGGGSGDPGVDLTEWTWWWELEKELHLEVRARLGERGATSGSDGFFLGRGQKRPPAADDRRPSAATIRGEILPALRRALEAERGQDLRTACLVAIARIGAGEEAERPELEPLLRRHLADLDPTVAETAALALGILGREESAFLLADLLGDREPGRRAVGEEEVPPRLRSFAAYALALLGAKSAREDVRRFVVHSLTRGLAEDETASPDVATACVVGLGRVPLAPGGEFPAAGPAHAMPSTGSREAQMVHLLALLADERSLGRLPRAHVPTSLALLAGGPALDGSEAKTRAGEAILDRLAMRRGESAELVQSCVLALGFLGDADEDELDLRIRRVLIDLPGRLDDRQARHNALLAAGRVGARDGRSGPPGADELRAHLLRQLGGGKSDMRPWAALGLALLGRADSARGDPGAAAIAGALRSELAGAGSPIEAGAVCIAAGLMRDPEAGPLLLATFQRLRDDLARGHAAVGLGLLEAREALESIRRVAEEATYRPDLLRELALALGLLGDRTVVDSLVEKLERSSSLSAQASLARALGRIGDHRAVRPLLALLEDSGEPAQARAFAAVALGILADPEELPWNTVLAVGVNYTAAPPTLFDLQGNGVLNLL
ncbi:MAG: HEAT repeat domain-containing protein [Planctomycetota bacterium]